ncbi:hypothetical protein IQ06DRAFT_250469, partial [Phaeosphaeriaceae sp. SRC1lsM3a]
MPVQQRQKRLPISCEPCRNRKIRCSRPRGPPPCETCVHRSLTSSCVYAHRGDVPSPTHPPQPPTPLSERSTSASSLSGENLTARVARLEALVRVPNASEPEPPNPRPLTAPAKTKGALSFSNSGHVRFVPWPLYPDSSQPSCHPQQAATSSIDLSCGPYPVGDKHLDKQDLLLLLPPRTHCTLLKNVFFESFGSLFHILHDPTFDEQYAAFDCAPEAMPLSWLALLFAILGTAVTALDHSSRLLPELSRKQKVVDMIAELSERYRNATFRCLEADNYLWQQNLTTLQALVILMYGINHSHGQTWTLLGMTYHIALSIGCHVDPIDFGLDAVRCEERRRCWAGVMMLYLLQNTSLGHLGPDPRHASEGVRLPADLNDIDIVPDQQVLPTASGAATQMSYLLFKFRLYDISNDISTFVLNATQPTPAAIDRMDKAIRDEQASWGSKYLAHSPSVTMPLCHEVHLNILCGYAHQLMLLLHHQSMRTSRPNSPQYRRSATKCMESAKELLRVHSMFNTRTDLLPFGWYARGICSFHAFHAAVSLIAMLADHSWDADGGSYLPLLEACAERFETLSEVSSICHKAAPIVRSLLSTIETYATDVHSQPTTDSLLTRMAFTRSQPPTYPNPDVQSDWISNGSEADYVDRAQSHSSNNIFHHLDPQLWLASSSMAWNQWDSLLNGVSVDG